MIYAVMMILSESDYPNWYCVGYSDDPHKADKYLELRRRMANADKHCDTKYTIKLFSEEVFDKLIQENERFNVASPINEEYQGVWITESDEEFYGDATFEALTQTKINAKEIRTILRLFDDEDCRKLSKDLKKLIKRIDQDELFWKLDWNKAMKHFG